MLLLAVVLKFQSRPLTPKVPPNPPAAFHPSSHLVLTLLCFTASPPAPTKPPVATSHRCGLINGLQHDLTKETFIYENPFEQTQRLERDHFGGRGSDFFSVEMLLLGRTLRGAPISCPPHQILNPRRTSRPISFPCSPPGPDCIILHGIRSLFVWDGKFKGRDTLESSLSLSCSWNSLSLLQSAAISAF